MKKFKAFTLLELIVAIACASILLTSVSVSIIFVSKVNDNSLTSSTTMYQLVNVKDYIIKNQITDNSSISCDHNQVTAGNNVIASGADIKAITFYDKDDFIYCKISYADVTKTKSLDFVVCEKGE